MAKRRMPKPQPPKARKTVVDTYINLYATRLRENTRDQEGIVNTIHLELKTISGMTDDDIAGRMFNLYRYSEIYHA